MHANVEYPLICPVLGLSLYWMTVTFGNAINDSLFDGDCQHDRFRKTFLITAGDTESAMRILEFEDLDIDPHSIRKVVQSMPVIVQQLVLLFRYAFESWLGFNWCCSKIF